MNDVFYIIKIVEKSTLSLPVLLRSAFSYYLSPGPLHHPAAWPLPQPHSISQSLPRCHWESKFRYDCMFVFVAIGSSSGLERKNSKFRYGRYLPYIRIVYVGM